MVGDYWVSKSILDSLIAQTSYRGIRDFCRWEGINRMTLWRAYAGVGQMRQATCDKVYQVFLKYTEDDQLEHLFY
jgi:hypothetical protein